MALRAPAQQRLAPPAAQRRPLLAAACSPCRQRLPTRRGWPLCAAAAGAATATAAPSTTQAATPAEALAAAPASSSQPGLGGFSWTSCWYPVHVLESIDPSKPHGIELLGRSLVLWCDGAAWQCMDDACPHRLAPLSEGRVEGGTLMCSYHGWRWDSRGKCVDIPQALDAKAKATACSSSRSCAVRYPVREAHGLIWVWPSAGEAAEAAAAAAPLPVSKGLEAAAARGQRLRWYRRELPYSWDILIENLTDPSHLPFSHHNLMPSLKREHAAAMPFTPVDVPAGADEEAARPGYALPHAAPLAAFEFPSALSSSGHVAFHPPSTVVYEYELAGTGLMQNDLIAVPAGPGRSVAFTVGSNTRPPISNADLLRCALTNPRALPRMAAGAMFQRQPTVNSHLLSNKLFDQDNVFLHMQDREIALRGKERWARDYYLPAPCDGLVIQARRWATQALQLPVPPPAAGAVGNGASGAAGAAPTAAQLFSLSAEQAALSPRLQPQQINDRFAQHTAHCVVCQRALKELQRKLWLAQAAAAAALAGLVGLLAGTVLPAVLASVLGGGGSGGAPAAVVGAAAALLGLGALVAAAVAKSTAATIAKFHYVEFSHATNH